MKTIGNIIYRTFQHIINTPKIKFSFFSIIGVILISTILLTINIVGKTYEYNIGDIAKEEIRVPKDIFYINKSETRMKKKRVSESIPIVFDKDASILAEKMKVVNILFGHIFETLKNYPPLGTDDMTFQVIALKSKLPKYLKYDDKVLAGLLSYNRTYNLKKKISRILIYIYDDNEMGLLEKTYENPLNIENKNIVIRTINASDTDVEVSSSLENLKTIDDVRKNLYKITYGLAPELPGKVRNAAITIISRNLKPNLQFNSEETRRRINEKFKTIKPVMSSLKKGQTIVREGDTITLEVKHRLDIYNQHTEGSHVSYVVGIFLLQVIFVFIFGYFLLRFSKQLIPDKKSTIILFTFILSFMIFAFVISRTESIMSDKLRFALLLPIPFVTMIISILYNMYLAMLVGVYMVFFASLLNGGDVSTIVVAFSSALLGVFVNANVDRRTDFLRGGFILGSVNTLVIFAVAFMQEIPIRTAVNNIHIAFASGIVNAILVLGILPLYENVFGITTKFKLLELADLNADIFKQMLMEAPGTYNHSLLVSTMAETACKDINANYMLARVGAFYHDIGKIKDAGMYIENKVTDPRAKILSPRDYSHLIVSHVRKGVEIAKKNELPEAVIDFIREHHGQTTMTFFYHQALADASGGQTVKIDKKEFQYPGPKPHSKETAVVMLADAIEAASRSLQEPSYEKLEGLVRKIIYNKLNEGELDFSDLSMTELNVVSQSFLRILNGIFHTRIEYPDATDVRNLENRVLKNGKN